MKRDHVDLLLQLAFLEGHVTTRGLYEKTVLAKKDSVITSPEARSKLLDRLEAILDERKETRRIPQTVGSFLKFVRSERMLEPQEISEQVGLTANVYRMLEEDRISPMKVPVESWKKFRSFFELSLDKLEDMIVRTHQLVVFRPSFRATLARYKEKKGAGRKTQALNTAVRELYTRARLKLPEEDQRKLSDLMRAIAQ